MGSYFLNFWSKVGGEYERKNNWNPQIIFDDYIIISKEKNFQVIYPQSVHFEAFQLDILPLQVKLLLNQMSMKASTLWC